MQIKAKFSSKCSACARWITPGAEIFWEKGRASRHVDCNAAGVSQSPPPAAAPPPDKIIWTRIGSAWGLRSPAKLDAGATVEVSKRDGSTTRAVVAALVGEATDGAGWLYAVAPRPPRGKRAFTPCGYPGCSPGFCDDCEGVGSKSGSWYC